MHDDILERGGMHDDMIGRLSIHGCHGRCASLGCHPNNARRRLHCMPRTVISHSWQLTHANVTVARLLSHVSNGMSNTEELCLDFFYYNCTVDTQPQVKCSTSRTARFFTALRNPSRTLLLQCSLCTTDDAAQPRISFSMKQVGRQLRLHNCTGGVSVCSCMIPVCPVHHTYRAP